MTHDATQEEITTPKREWTLHGFVMLTSMAILAASGTWLVPAGKYERADMPNGRTMVVDRSYQVIESTPVGFNEFLPAIYEGMLQAAPIIMFIYLVGGAFGVVGKTEAVETGIAAIAKRLAGRELLLIPVIMLLFGLVAGTFGLFEEVMPFILLLVPIAIRLGFDSIVGASLMIVGAAAGFSAAFTNPFTVGVAQGIAELPIFSGLEVRLVCWAIFMAVAIAYVTVYAHRVRKDPTKSLLYHQDRARASEFADSGLSDKLTTRQKCSLVVVTATVLFIGVAVQTLGWGMGELAGLFLIMALAVGLISGFGFNGTAQRFADGCQDMTSAALMVGFAYTILVALTKGNIIDTILHGLTNVLGGMPATLAAVGMFVVQSLLNFVVSSGSGQAALTMPLMTPLSDLIGVDRQVAVLAYQMGDGITNIFAPTSGILLAAIGLARIPYTVWVKFIWPLIVIQSIVEALMIAIIQLFVWVG